MSARRLLLYTASIFVLALLVQALHEVEHVAQVYQRLWLGMGPQQAHGILFFLDVEWNHFLFNLGYLLLLSLVALYLLIHPTFAREQLGKKLFWTGFFIQAYHVVEHTVRMGQFFELGCTPCPGILGWYFDLAYLHFAFNTAALLLPLALLPAFVKALKTSKVSD